ncbi:Aste57867_9308 [Aphanomyces stellatus]|uniref:Aste57867_9308 protein n=1 Tax=Aphanomyces stellatus TaxID=120398 RepID=A0A485KMP5_9STRA|nr:hypothetical protein As57867_009272 [Aphanomyces stellatus]VFT86190.1 Aste57867_9308 [Aphanomyces stellatus]
MLVPTFKSWGDDRALLAQWSIVGSIFLHQRNAHAPTSDDISLLQSLRVVTGPFLPSTLDAAVAWLDKGALQVVLETSYDELVAGIASDVPSSRVFLSLSLTDAQLADPAVAAVLPTLSSGVYLTNVATPAALVRFRSLVPETYRMAVVDAPLDLLPMYHQQHVDIVATPPSALAPGLAFAQCCRSDRPDGLFATVVTDTSGVALGLVYSSIESIVASVAECRGIFYSRSRGGLWRKGDSSGHTQELKQLDLDCDSDAVRCTVLQHASAATTPDTGAFCHLHTRTCWGPATGIRELQLTLQDRLVSAPSGSYTKRLFDDQTLLRHKLVEEAQELAEATDPTHVAEEAADVLYFAMVRAVAANVSFQDVEAQLTLRARKLTRRPGHAKTYRIDAAAAILAKQNS